MSKLMTKTIKKPSLKRGFTVQVIGSFTYAIGCNGKTTGIRGPGFKSPFQSCRKVPSHFSALFPHQQNEDKTYF